MRIPKNPKNLTALREYALAETQRDIKSAKLPKDFFGGQAAEHNVDIVLDYCGIDKVLSLVREFLYTGK